MAFRVEYQVDPEVLGEVAFQGAAGAGMEEKRRYLRGTKMEDVGLLLRGLEQGIGLMNENRRFGLDERRVNQQGEQFGEEMDFRRDRAAASDEQFQQGLDARRELEQMQQDAVNARQQRELEQYKPGGYRDQYEQARAQAEMDQIEARGAVRTGRPTQRQLRQIQQIEGEMEAVRSDPTLSEDQRKAAMMQLQQQRQALPDVNDPTLEDRWSEMILEKDGRKFQWVERLGEWKEIEDPKDGADPRAKLTLNDIARLRKQAIDELGKEDAEGNVTPPTPEQIEEYINGSIEMMQRIKTGAPNYSGVNRKAEQDKTLGSAYYGASSKRGDLKSQQSTVGVTPGVTPGTTPGINPNAANSAAQLRQMISPQKQAELDAQLGALAQEIRAAQAAGDTKRVIELRDRGTALINNALGGQ